MDLIWNLLDYSKVELTLEDIRGRKLALDCWGWYFQYLREQTFRKVTRHRDQESGNSSIFKQLFHFTRSQIRIFVLIPSYEKIRSPNQICSSNSNSFQDPILNKDSIIAWFEECMKILKTFKIPFEKDVEDISACCARLEITREISGVITDNPLMFSYGVQNIYRHFKIPADCLIPEISHYNLSNITGHPSTIPWSKNKFICLNNLLTSMQPTISGDGKGTGSRRMFCNYSDSVGERDELEKKVKIALDFMTDHFNKNKYGKDDDYCDPFKRIEDLTRREDFYTVLDAALSRTSHCSLCNHDDSLNGHTTIAPCLQCHCTSTSIKIKGVGSGENFSKKKKIVKVGNLKNKTIKHTSICSPMNDNNNNNNNSLKNYKISTGKIIATSPVLDSVLNLTINPSNVRSDCFNNATTIVERSLKMDLNTKIDESYSAAMNNTDTNNNNNSLGFKSVFSKDRSPPAILSDYFSNSGDEREKSEIPIDSDRNSVNNMGKPDLNMYAIISREKPNSIKPSVSTSKLINASEKLDLKLIEKPIAKISSSEGDILSSKNLKNFILCSCYWHCRIRNLGISEQEAALLAAIKDIKRLKMMEFKIETSNEIKKSNFCSIVWQRPQFSAIKKFAEENKIKSREIVSYIIGFDMFDLIYGFPSGDSMPPGAPTPEKVMKLAKKKGIEIYSIKWKSIAGVPNMSKEEVITEEFKNVFSAAYPKTASKYEGFPIYTDSSDYLSSPEKKPKKRRYLKQSDLVTSTPSSSLGIGGNRQQTNTMKDYYAARKRLVFETPKRSKVEDNSGGFERTTMEDNRFIRDRRDLIKYPVSDLMTDTICSSMEN